MDWTIVMFWGLVLLLVLVIFWLLKRFLGRILLIFFFVAMLCGVFYLLNPQLAMQSWNTVKDLPYTLKWAEKADLDIDLPAVELDVPYVQWETSETAEQEQYSWFASWFGFGKTSEKEVAPVQEVEPSEPEKQEESQISTAFVVEEKKEVVPVVSSEEVKVSEEKTDEKLTGATVAPVEKVEEMIIATSKVEEKAFEELVLDPSEYTVSIDAKGMIVIRLREEGEVVSLPAELKKEVVEQKQSSQTILTKPTSTKHLTDQDLREANEIFNL